MATRERTKWMAAFGMIGTLTVVGAVSALVPRAVHATPPTQQAAQHAAQRGAQAPNGQTVYNSACGRCHPGGRQDIGPAILNKNLAENRMTQIVRQGTGRMKAIPTKRLPDANMPALMTYLRSIHAVR